MRKHVTILASALILAGLPAKAEMRGGPFASLSPVDVAQLDQTVGRLLLPDGSKVHFTLALSQVLDGRVVNDLTLSTLEGLNLGNSATPGTPLQSITADTLRTLLPGIANTLDRVEIRNLSALTIDYTRAASQSWFLPHAITGVELGLHR